MPLDPQDLREEVLAAEAREGDGGKERRFFGKRRQALCARWRLLKPVLKADTLGGEAPLP
jgi:hypothetical protein